MSVDAWCLCYLQVLGRIAVDRLSLDRRSFSVEMVLPVKSTRFLIFTRPFNRLESAWVNVHVTVRILSNVREKVEWPHGSGDPVLVANRFFLCLHVHLSIHAFLDCLLDLSFSPLSSRLLSAVQIRSSSHSFSMTVVVSEPCLARFRA